VRLLAKFLEAAADKASWVSVEREGDTLVLTAADERERLARLVVTTKHPYTVIYTDEWGLLK
jgi:hypothetical protein